MTEALREDGPEPDEQCLEKRVYYKVISGAHPSILACPPPNACLQGYMPQYLPISVMNTLINPLGSGSVLFICHIYSELTTPFSTLIYPASFKE